MTKTNGLIVRASGRKLDQLRGDASRIAKGNKVDWWIEQADKGTRFCFEDAEAKKSFASICENFAVPCVEA
ncbi:hypothetical protein [Bradyrhizobium niftali]|uniref:Uncharacterized protein n=1 Tax=Bradyrhizobium niftali TaxID=2560055 RepID=A0A4Y9LH23_9BRAD|nr:hypothetical protein [Bradyrhizobium niftali]TFV41283.1 hypothetical protein E4K65_37100 [Bradyrhizobium niftali]